MLYQFDAQYFDGQTSKPVMVKVSMMESSLSINASEPYIAKQISIQQIHFFRSIDKDRIVINFNEGNAECVDISYPEIASIFTTQYPGLNRKNKLSNWGQLSNRKVSLLLGCLLLLIGIIYFYGIPMIGEASTKLISKQQEMTLGNTIYENLIKSYRQDTLKTRIANQLVKKIDFQSPYDIQVTVVHEKEKNAFALPGGHIVIFTGLLDAIEDHAAFFALLAHEVSHVNHQHALRSIFRSMATSLFISVLLSDVNGVSSLLIDNANQFKTLSFSRNLESEADAEGLKVLLHNGIDPNGMIRLFKILMQQSDELDQQWAFLSTHPLTKKRIETIEKKIALTKYTTVDATHLDTLWQQLKVWGE